MKMTLNMNISQLAKSHTYEAFVILRRDLEEGGASLVMSLLLQTYIVLKILSIGSVVTVQKQLK
jgi:hypothetical protein